MRTSKRGSLCTPDTAEGFPQPLCLAPCVQAVHLCTWAGVTGGAWSPWDAHLYTKRFLCSEPRSGRCGARRRLTQGRWSCWGRRTHKEPQKEIFLCPHQLSAFNGSLSTHKRSHRRPINWAPHPGLGEAFFLSPHPWAPSLRMEPRPPHWPWCGEVKHIPAPHLGAPRTVWDPLHPVSHTCSQCPNRLLAGAKPGSDPGPLACLECKFRV